MMKITALALLAGSAAAFAPAQVAKSSTALNAEKSKALPFMNRPALLDGSMAGDVGFDPLGFPTLTMLELTSTGFVRLKSNTAVLLCWQSLVSCK
ncbi:chlorophyll a-b binding domain-containing protein [Skeletonema marinoi]|uniref:Chlorophyll a-b binding domain-containing protein n=1 Tax=Skeletonema marinoi TaxID=267567 RepID=A0AAD8YLD6_9STRA|nr:chlorophyll a-b binding domain-containing protein [Skeletonema marinoi]